MTSVTTTATATTASTIASTTASRTASRQAASRQAASTGPVVVSVAPGSPAALAGVVPGDEVARVNGEVPRDIIEWRVLTDAAEVSLDLVRPTGDAEIDISKREGEPLGIEVQSAVFDRVRTCDNHCEFCFIYQLPKGMRRSLYLKDDDYRLSFLYGNFTTLTRFTEADLERVVTEHLSPLHVSIHSTDPDLRSRMLKNPRGAMSLRWLRALLDHGIEVRGQVVVCPGVNDGAELDRTLAGVLDRFPELSSVAVVPLGLSRFNDEAAMRLHTLAEARAVVDIVERWQTVFAEVLGRRLVHAADEYYLMADRPFPPAEHYEGFEMHEDGIGMARTFELEFEGRAETPTGVRSGFFAAVDLPSNPAAYTSLRSSAGSAGHGGHGGHGGSGGGSGCGGSTDASPGEGAGTITATTITATTITATTITATTASLSATAVTLRPRRSAPVAILTGELGARVLAPLIERLGRDDVRIVPVHNEFFGGNTGVTGLLTGADLTRVLAEQPEGHRYLLPDVCLSDEGRFLDGPTVSDLPRPVEVVPTDGIALRRALETS